MWLQQSPASPDTGLQNESKLIFFIPSDVIFPRRHPHKLFLCFLLLYKVQKVQ